MAELSGRDRMILRGSRLNFPRNFYDNLIEKGMVEVVNGELRFTELGINEGSKGNE